MSYIVKLERRKVYEFLFPVYADNSWELLRPQLEAKLGEVIDILVIKGNSEEETVKLLAKVLKEVSNAIFLDIVLDNILDIQDIELEDIMQIPDRVNNLR